MYFDADEGSLKLKFLYSGKLSTLSVGLLPDNFLSLGIGRRGYEYLLVM